MLHRRVVAGVALAALAGCGGGELNEPLAPTATAPAEAARSTPAADDAVRLPAGFGVRRVSFPGDATPAAARRDGDVAATPTRAGAPSPPTLRVYNAAGAWSNGFRLAPVHGSGYASLRLVLQGTDTQRPVPDAAWHPRCESDTRCVYTALRRGDPSYAVSLGAHAPARLSAADGMIVMSARQMRLPADTTLSVTLTGDAAGEPQVRRVTYLAAPG